MPGVKIRVPKTTLKHAIGALQDALEELGSTDAMAYVPAAVELMEAALATKEHGPVCFGRGWTYWSAEACQAGATMTQNAGLRTRLIQANEHLMEAWEANDPC